MRFIERQCGDRRRNRKGSVAAVRNDEADPVRQRAKQSDKQNVNSKPEPWKQIAVDQIGQCPLSENEVDCRYSPYPAVRF